MPGRPPDDRQSRMTRDQIEIVPVRSRREQGEFIQFAWRHYAGDPLWIPPLIGNQKELLNYKRHPFYDNARIQTFLARRGGEVVGRIAAIVDEGHNQAHKERRGMFGFFESVDETAVSRALFDAVRQWHADQGITLLRGPLNPALNHECGLLVDGFHSSPTFLMTYNKPYYARLVEDYGFVKSQDLFAYRGHVNMLETLDPKLSRIADQAAERFGVTVRGTTSRRLASDVREFLRVYNAALPGTWGFVPLSDAEVTHMAAGLKMLLLPNLIRIAEHNGRVVGIALTLPDYNPVIRQINGRLFPFGFIRLLMAKRRIRRLRMISTNVVPEFQRWGIGLVLMKDIASEVLRCGIEEAEFSWVLESNLLSRQTLERGGAILDKTYRIYDWAPS